MNVLATIQVFWSSNNYKLIFIWKSENLLIYQMILLYSKTNPRVPSINILEFRVTVNQERTFRILYFDVYSRIDFLFLTKYSFWLENFMHHHRVMNILCFFSSCFSHKCSAAHFSLTPSFFAGQKISQLEENGRSRRSLFFIVTPSTRGYTFV